MPAIIPIPAFTDNYIWLVREGRNAAVVDPGDAAPVLAYLDREGRTQAHAGRALTDAVESFAELRAWKNGF